MLCKLLRVDEYRGCIYAVGSLFEMSRIRQLSRWLLILAEISCFFHGPFDEFVFATHFPSSSPADQPLRGFLCLHSVEEFVDTLTYFSIFSAENNDVRFVL